MDFDLNLGLDTLSLRPQGLASPASTDTSNAPKFLLFPTLPTELRLKIISHALPPPTTFKLTANILIADPAFGFYLVFSITPPRLPPPSDHSFGFGRHPLRADRRWYVEARSLNLLETNREMREYYIEKFPYTIQAGHSRPWLTGGLIRYSSQDSVMFRNFAQLAGARSRLQLAIMENWRLQNFWDELSQLELGIEVSRPELIDGCACALARMKGMQRVILWLWRGFGEDQAEEVRVQVRRAIEENRLKALENLVREIREKECSEQNESNEVFMPEFKLMG